MIQWMWLGERALLRRFDGELIEANEAARGLFQTLGARTLPEIEDVVPGARTVLVVLRPGASPSDELHTLLSSPTPATSTEGNEYTVHVRYDGEDLVSVAHEHGLTGEEVVRLHSEPTYVVGFIGFSPGFPYLIGLPRELHTPRLTTPRTKVPTGSVAIAGAFTGIYPAATPGGWHILGRASVELFDPGRDPPALMRPGDRVRFVPA